MVSFPVTITDSSSAQLEPERTQQLLCLWLVLYDAYLTFADLSIGVFVYMFVCLYVCACMLECWYVSMLVCWFGCMFTCMLLCW